MKPLRIGLFIQHFPPYLGGAEIQARLLAGELTGRGHEVRVASTRFRRDLPARSASGDVAIWRLPTFSAKWLKLPVNLFMGCLAGLRMGRQVDVFHAHCLSPFTLGAVLAAKLLRRPILIKICSVGDHGDIARIKGFGPGGVLWRAFRHCDLFIAGTSAAAREVIDHGIEAERVALIPSLFPEQSRRPGDERRGDARRRLGLPERTTLAYVGRLDEGKGLSLLMEIWPELNRRHRVQLLIVGEGPQEGEIQRWRKEARQQDSVIIAGYQPDPDPWYQASDILVFLSRSESFGNVLVEAMSHRLAVASTPVGVVQDWPQDAPLQILDATRPDQVAATLGGLIEDETARRRLGREAADFISGRYGAPAVTAMYLQQYRRLLGCFPAADE